MPASPSSSDPALTGAQRRYLRGLAQPRRPLVQVGAAGLAPGVVAAIEQALLDHELVKVRLIEPEDKRGLAEQVASACGAHLCGLVGHTVILYRRHPERPRIVLPRAGGAAGGGQ